MSTAGEDTDDTAKSRLRILNKHFREHPVTGPEGHCVTGPGSRPTPVTPGLPYPARITEHIDRSVAEVAAHTRAVNPEAGPLPARVEAVYDWYREHTANAPTAEQQRRDTIVYRQRLEHAIAMGDTKVIRPHRCPGCRTFGLMWVHEAQRAVCTNARCTTKAGLSSSFSLARLAYVHIAAQYRAENSVRVHAT
ncbi:hypothetical protein [Streptomyces caniscabiei]|uniref:Uncharacterized protein n=1 Tax=Streptomyces caniscabiei TaxID=2746961 RepID=A0ABU4N0U3_9ACTN|nr:hypothetical protein [Streptomyces caniscabiei]MBE4790302.1 hypothetical protein [Streptomyces caniscabiei]MBE4799469.1 hypothetical protein [Streptomyces caniscabiei]MDX3015159.1 hypothetical protein [Streptomyces caniscabiei]MDX3042602.1 hypothetical protein [Streptomyces caniscabiei]